MRAEGSSSSETMTDGLSARRDEARTSLTASPEEVRNKERLSGEELRLFVIE